MNLQAALGCIPDDQADRDLATRATGHPCVPYKGSVPGTCVKCKKKLWIGPTQQRMLAAQPDLPTICLACAAPEVAAGAKARPLTNKAWGE